LAEKAAAATQIDGSFRRRRASADSGEMRAERPRERANKKKGPKNAKTVVSAGVPSLYRHLGRFSFSPFFLGAFYED